MLAIMNKRLKQARKAKYVEALAAIGIIGPAAKIAGVHRRTILDWQNADKKFAKACDDAYEEAIDSAELKVRERGVDGWEKPIIYKGEPMFRRDPVTGDVLLDGNFDPIPLTESIRNDDLLKFYMEANRQKYNKKTKLEHSGPNGGDIPTGLKIRFVDSDGDGGIDPLDA